MFVVWEKQHAADRPKHRSHYADRHNHRLSQTSRVGQRTKKDWFSIGFTVFETARQHRVGLVSACVRVCACVRACVRVCVLMRRGREREKERNERGMTAMKGPRRRRGKGWCVCWMKTHLGKQDAIYRDVIHGGHFQPPFAATLHDPPSYFELRSH